MELSSLVNTFRESIWTTGTMNRYSLSSLIIHEWTISSIHLHQFNFVTKELGVVLNEAKPLGGMNGFGF